MDSSKECIFPMEIFENILRFVDGHTLMQAELVNDEWRKLVEYVGRKYNVWEKSFKKDIPAKDVYAMTRKCNCNSESNKWEVLYRNWTLWQRLESKHNSAVMITLPFTIYCAKMSGRFIIIGEESGAIIAIDENNTILFNEVVTHCRDPIVDLHFLNEVSSCNDEHFRHTHLVIVCERTVYIYTLQPLQKCLTLFNVKHISVYKRMLCYALSCQTIIVNMVGAMEKTKEYSFLTQNGRLNKAGKIKSLCIYEKLVGVITDSKVLLFEHSGAGPPISIIIGPEMNFPWSCAERYWTFYNEFVFCLSNVYLYYTNFNSLAVPYKVNTLEILGALVCDICMHGSILIISMCSGNVYMYLLKKWLKFDLRKYQYVIKRLTEPICSTDVQELDIGPKLVISSSNCLVQIVMLDKL